MNIRKIIREELEKVMNPPSEVIDIDTDEGNIFGVIHHDREHLNNWIEKERIQPNLDTIPDDELFPIGILKNIDVDEEYRNEGVGGDLLDSFITECSHCKYIILIADTGEENGFDIIDWYKSNDFAIWGESGGMPVMIKKIDDISEIYLSAAGNTFSTRPKPGAGRKFPEEKPNGGHSLNISVDDGPHQFPKAEDF
jgi:GNAT superfamily N-acetyltransferase